MSEIVTEIDKSLDVLTYKGKEKKGKIKITVIDYTPETLEEKEMKDFRDCFAYKDSKSISWINVDGIHDPTIVQKIGKYYGFHPLLLEDIVNTSQRPKIDYYDDHIFIVLKMLYYNRAAHNIETEQVSFILGEGYVFSFQEDREGDVFDPVRQRLKVAGKNKLRYSNSDFLLYSLLNTVTESNYNVIDELGEDIEHMEKKIMENFDENDNKILYDHKRELSVIRKSVYPLREVFASLERNENELINTSTKIFLKDLSENTIRVIDITESYFDMVSSLMEIYHNNVSNKMNAVMKVLTIISTVFIPLTFITGVYGMNFEFMPELHMQYSYFIVLTICFSVAGGLLYYFRQKKWL